MLGQICFAFRRDSGTTRIWYVMQVVIMVYLLRLIVESHRGASFQPNVCVNCVVREWLWQVLGVDIAHNGVGDLVHNQCIAFFLDNGLVATRCPEWLQSSFTILINLFKCIGLWTKAKKTTFMTCFSGKIRIACTEAQYASQQTGLGTSTTEH
jgi:hypothetical protein